ncbi:MAG: hypothetical protein K2H51_01255, partial [Malacoplasma sp.]|nr:hypothetical protein [Malacoplasma sp.]
QLQKETEQLKNSNKNSITQYWQLFKGKTNGEFNGVILITSCFALIYVVLNSLILAGVLSA